MSLYSVSKAFLVIGNVCLALIGLRSLLALLEIKQIGFYSRSCLESQVF